MLQAQKLTADMLLLNNAEVGNTHGMLKAIHLGATIDCRNSNGCTPLMLAAANNHMQASQILIEKEANVNAVDNDGNTAFMHAAKNGSEFTLALLQKAGANMLAKNIIGETALAQAIDNKKYLTAKRLLGIPSLDPFYPSNKTSDEKLQSLIKMFETKSLTLLVANSIFPSEAKTAFLASFGRNDISSHSELSEPEILGIFSQFLR